MKTLRFLVVSVVTFVSAFFLTVDLAVAIETAAPATVNQRAPLEEIRERCGGARPTTAGAAQTTWDQCYDDVASGSGGSAARCRTQTTEFNTLKTAFNSSCSRAGMTGSGRNCFVAAACCVSGGNSVASEGDPRAADCEDTSSADESASDRTRESGTSTLDAVLSGATRQRSARASRPSARVRATRTRYRYCPSQAGDDLERAQERADRADEKANTARDRLEAAQEKLVEAQNKQLEDRETIQQEMTDLQQGYEDDVKAIQDGLQERQGALLEEINQLGTQLSEAEGRLRELNLAERNAWDAFIQAGMTQRSRCHSEALKAVTDLRNANAQLASQGRLTAGGFNSVLRGSGLTDVQRGTNLVENLRRRCTGDDNYKSETRANEMRRDAALRQIADARVTANGQVASLQGQIAAKRDSAPSEVQKAMQELQRLSQRSQQNLQRLQQRSARQEQSNASKIALADQAVKRAQAALSIAERNERDNNSLLDLANSSATRSGGTAASSSGTTTGGGGVSAEAESQYSSLMSMAEPLFIECGCCANSGSAACVSAIQVYGSETRLRTKVCTPNATQQGGTTIQPATH